MFIVNVEGAVWRDGRWLIIERSAEEAHAGGTLSLVGGRAELEGNAVDLLERTVRREILEEVGVEVKERLHYVHNSSFVSDDGNPVVNVVFLCEYEDGEARRASPDEVAAVEWMTAAEVMAHPKSPPWTKESVRRAERLLAQVRANG